MKKTVVDWLEDTLEKYPNKAAFADEKKRYSFIQLVENAKKIASYIVGNGIFNEPIVIFMKKTSDCVVAMLAALYAGCYYSPVDDSMPIERLKTICSILKPKLIICDSYNKKQTSGIFGDEFKIADFDMLMDTKMTDERCFAEIRRRVCKDDLMYVLFTSGSTGIPKGVCISHRAAIDFGEWICEKYSFDDRTKMCNQAPFYFDASLPDIVIPLMSGAELYIPPKSYYVFPKNILKYIIDHRINTIIWVPSALKTVVDCHALEVCVPDCIELVVFCGEVLPVKYLREWKESIPGAQFVNMYGPTETTYACTYYDIGDLEEIGDVIPLGRACENCKVVLLNEQEEEIIDGEIGEICVSGDCLFNGYYRDFQTTNKAISYRKKNAIWKEKIYRTGDLGYRDENGLLFYSGRKDFQIKKMGYRIELGEIENALISINGISGCCCLFESKKESIIAIYTGCIDENTIKMELKQKLPQYMIPDSLCRVESIPLNINGKIDRNGLREKYVKEM